MCERTLDPELSYIDIFSNNETKDSILRMFSNYWLYTRCENDLHGMYRAAGYQKFTVYHLTLRMINDVFSVGKKIEIKTLLMELMVNVHLLTLLLLLRLDLG